MLKVFFLFIISVSAYSYNYLHFDLKKEKVTKAKYNKYIAPQLESINKEYYYFISKFNKELGPRLDEIRSLSKEIQKSWQDSSFCIDTVDSSCLYKKLYPTSAKLDKTISKLQESFWSKNKTNKLSASTLIKVAQHLDKVLLENYKLLHKLEELKVLENEITTIQRSKYDEIHSLLSAQNQNVTELFLSLLDPKKREQFYKLYLSFISPIEKSFSKNDTKMRFLKRLGPYNLAWNSFQKNMTKSDIKIDKEEKHHLTRMHNRWNYILKAILR